MRGVHRNGVHVRPREEGDQARRGQRVPRACGEANTRVMGYRRRDLHGRQILVCCCSARVGGPFRSMLSTQDLRTVLCSGGIFTKGPRGQVSLPAYIL